MHQYQSRQKLRQQVRELNGVGDLAALAVSVEQIEPLIEGHREAYEAKKVAEAAIKAARREQVLATHLTTPPPTNNKVKEDQSASPVKPGQYVFVAQDLSPGKFSHGGEAWVKAVHGTGGSIVCDVEYIKNTGGNVTREEKAVPLSRLTVKINASP
jgi:hypothetical protein